MRLQDYLNGKFYLWGERFVITKSKNPMMESFATIRDKNELTVIIEESKVNWSDVVEVEKDWRILTFDMILPFGLVGFLAMISQALTDINVSIFVISAYSTDHFLIKEKDLPKARARLESLGFKVIEK